MSDLDKAIREAAYTVDRNKLHAALAVVLDRHVHTGDDDVYIGPKVFWRCRECGGLGGRWCPTVLGIARALDLPPVSSQDTPPAPRQPRVWREGDAEPPAGVDVLWDPIAEGEAYLCRLANGMWEWFDSPDDRHGVRVDSTWEVAMQEADGPLTEVVSPEGTS